MLNKNVVARLTAITDIKRHNWFSGYAWEKLISLSADIPFVPKIEKSKKSKIDTYLNYMTKFGKSNNSKGKENSEKQEKYEAWFKNY